MADKDEPVKSRKIIVNHLDESSESKSSDDAPTLRKRSGLPLIAPLETQASKPKTLGNIADKSSSGVAKTSSSKPINLGTGSTNADSRVKSPADTVPKPVAESSLPSEPAKADILNSNPDANPEKVLTPTEPPAASLAETPQTEPEDTKSLQPSAEATDSNELSNEESASVVPMTPASAEADQLAQSQIPASTPSASSGKPQQKVIKKEIITKKYRVPIGHKTKPGRQQKKPHNGKRKIWLIVLMALLLPIAAGWAIAYFWLPQIALDGYFDKLVGASSYRYVMSVNLSTTSPDRPVNLESHLSGTIEQSRNEVTASHTEIGDGTTQTRLDYLSDQHYRTMDGKTVRVPASQVKDEFKNNCGANELAILINAFTTQASTRQLDGHIQASPWLVSRDPIVGLDYEGMVNSSSVSGLFDAALKDFASACGVSFASDQTANLENLLKSSPTQVRYVQGLVSDRLEMTIISGQTSLNITLATSDYGTAMVATPIITKNQTNDSQDQPKPACDTECRDNERKADLIALNNLVTKYADEHNGEYPESAALKADKFPSADPDIFKDPDGKAINEGGKYGYTYGLLPEGCEADEAMICTSYQLTTLFENGDTYKLPEFTSFLMTGSMSDAS